MLRTGPHQVVTGKVEATPAGAKIALQHNLGLGGAAVVAMYAKADLG